LTGCGVLNGTAPEEASPSASPVAFQARTPAPETVPAGACFDGSSSSVPSFSSVELSRLQQAVGHWSPDTPVTADGAPPRPGLHLSVRQVLTNSYSSSAGSLTLEIPAVPGLVARPNATDPGFVEADRQWQSAKKQYEADSATAAAAATQAAGALEHYQLQRQNSEISGCVSALAQTITGSSRRLILVSDLEQNGQPQIAGDMSGTSVLIVQACGGSAAKCTNLADAWTSQLKSQGTAVVRILRPESSSPSSYTSFLKGVLA